LGGYMETKKAYDQNKLITYGDFWLFVQVQ
jgi:hypothetical protein